MNRKKCNFAKKDWIEIISYITYSVSIFILVYVQVNMDCVNLLYQKAIFWMFLSAIWLFREHTVELTKEIIKATTILLATNILPLYLDGTIISPMYVIEIYISSIVYYLVGYGIIRLVRNSFKFHGNFAYILESGFCIFSYILIFCAHLNYIISLIIPAIISLFIGFKIYQQKVRTENLIKRVRQSWLNIKEQFNINEEEDI